MPSWNCVTTIQESDLFLVLGNRLVGFAAFCRRPIAALAGTENAHRLAVLRHRAAGDRDAGRRRGRGCAAAGALRVAGRHFGSANRCAGKQHE